MNMSTVPDKFDWSYYVNNSPDLLAAGINTEHLATEHYLMYGYKENRKVCDNVTEPSVSNTQHIQTMNTPIAETQEKDTPQICIHNDDGIQINLPPLTLITDGSNCHENFLSVGRMFFKLFVDMCGLKPNGVVLDIGCCIGRVALPLTNYLGTLGEYRGFDIGRGGIVWCQQEITSKYVNFIFSYVDIYNAHYNPRGKMDPNKIVFDYRDGEFDVVCAVYLFNHMLAAELERYVGEISRVLKKGGTCLMTCFLWNSESKELVNKGKSVLAFKHHYNGYHIVNLLDVCHVVAHDESNLMRILSKYNLSLLHPIKYGNWCQRDAGLDFQDIIVVIKK